MARAILIVLDSVGCGAAADAASMAMPAPTRSATSRRPAPDGRGDRDGPAAGAAARCPTWSRLGLAHACAGLDRAALAGRRAACRSRRAGTATASRSARARTRRRAIGRSPAARCRSPGAISPRWRTAFPPELVAAIIREGGLPGILGNRHASGTAIIDELAAEHIATGKPICYTSVDSVLQIAAHEQHFGLERLYALCRTVRRLVDPLRIGRVIARPFVGSAEAGFTRTGNRKDFAIPPPDETILDRLAAQGRAVVTVGKIGDIFAHRATGEEIKRLRQRRDVRGGARRRWRSPARWRLLLRQSRRFRHRVRPSPRRAGLCRGARSVRRDAAARWRRRCGPAISPSSPPTMATIRPVRAPTTPASMCRSWPSVPASAPGSIGRRESFADIAATLGTWLGVGAVGAGTSFAPSRDKA